MFFRCVCITVHIKYNNRPRFHLVSWCSKPAHTKSHYFTSPISDPSANVVNSHPVADNSTQLSGSGQHHHFTSVTSVAAFQCYLSLPSLRWATGAESLGKLKPHRCATIVAQYCVPEGSICLLTPLRETLINKNLNRCSKTGRVPFQNNLFFYFVHLGEYNYTTAIISFLDACESEIKLRDFPLSKTTRHLI